jgi:hypothetical protein
MERRSPDALERTDATEPNIYLPAVTLPPNFGRLERFVNDLFSLHDVVLVPDRTDE